MALTIDVNLQVEDPTGSNNWILYPGSIRRKTGDSAHYRIFYTFSSTELGSFDSMQLDVTFKDQFNNMFNISGIGLPAGATSSYNTNANGMYLHIDLGSGLPPGQTAFIEFYANSHTEMGPNDYDITTAVAIKGEFVSLEDGSKAPVSLSNSGPEWIVDAIVPDDFGKIVYLNGNIHTSDEDSYLVEFQITNAYQPRWGHEGFWQVTGATITDTLPTIPGVTPEVIGSDTMPYTVSGNIVTWDFPSGYYGRNIVLRVKYPKDQVDAVGGIDAIGTLTNTMKATLNLWGNEKADYSASVDFQIKPVPASSYGKPNVEKAATYYRAYPIPGYGLYDSPLSYRYELRGRLTTDYNVYPDMQMITDEDLYFIMEDDSIWHPGQDEFVWANYKPSATDFIFEYQTASGGDNWITQSGTVPGENDFPTIATGDQITKWRVTSKDLIYPWTNNNVEVWVQLKQRTQEQLRIKAIINDMSYINTFPDGTSQNGTYQGYIPVEYNALLEVQIYTATAGATINAGDEYFFLVGVRDTGACTVRLNSSDIYVVVPPEFPVEYCRLAADYTHVPYDVIENWNGTGNQLVHIPLTDPIPALTDTYSYFYIVSRADVNIVPGEYYFDAWYAIDSEQANDHDITHVYTGPTAPDIYDFDKDGDTTEQISFIHYAVNVVSANVVNVLKMSKSAKDAEFKVNNDTQITRNEVFNYKLTVRNDSPDPMLDLVMIDIFPYVGDIFGSFWAPILNAPVSQMDGATVKYSTSTDPIMAPIGSGGTGTWTDAPPNDISTVRAIRLDFGDRIFAPGESANVIFDMRAPVSAPDMMLCYNSVHYIASADMRGTITPYLPAYSPPAYAKITYRVFDTGIGDFIWNDLNQNGIQDVGESGINDVLVELYDDNMNLMYTTITGNSPIDGSAGYYMFSGIWPGDYYVKYPTSLPLSEEYVLTLQHVGSDTTKDSDPNPETGLTYVISVADHQIRTDIDAGYIPKDSPPVKDSSIGDFVWRDLDGDGQQDVGEPGIDGVLVQLYDAGGNLLASTTTENGGYYKFSALEAGDYQIKFPLAAADGGGLTLQGQGTDRNRDSDPDTTTGYTALITLGKSENRLDIDAGYLPIEKPPLLTKSSNKEQVDVGETVVYTISFTNNNYYPVTDLVLYDVMDSEYFQYTSASVMVETKNGTVTADTSDSKIWKFSVEDSVPAFETVTLTVTTQVKQNTPAGTYKDHSYATYGTKTTPDTPDVPVIVNPNDNPPILTKSADKQQVEVGENVVYTISFTNKNNYPITDLVLYDVMDSEYFQYTSATVKIGSESGTVTADTSNSRTWKFSIQDSVPALETVTLTITTQVKQNTPAGMYKDHSYATYDSKTTPDTPDVPVVVNPNDNPPILTKSADKQQVEVGESVVYTISFTNKNNYPITDLVLYDVMDSEYFQYTSATVKIGSESGTVTADTSNSRTWKFSIQDSVPALETVTLTITTQVKQNTPAGTYKDHSYATYGTKTTPDTPDVPVIVTPSEKTPIILKSADKQQVAPGENVIYTIMFTNTNNYPITNLSLIDVMDSDYFQYTSASLMIGQQGGAFTIEMTTPRTWKFNVQNTVPALTTVTLSITTLVRENTPAGMYNDHAYATYGSKTTPNTPDVSVVVKTDEKPPIIKKKANRRHVNAGEDVIYTISFTNTNSYEITDLVLIDEMDSDYFKYTDATVLIGQRGGAVIVDTAARIWKFYVQNTVPAMTTVTLIITAKVLRNTPSGTYYDHAYATYGTKRTPDTPDVPVIVKPGDCPPPPCCHPCDCCEPHDCRESHDCHEAHDCDKPHDCHKSNKCHKVK